GPSSPGDLGLRREARSAGTGRGNPGARAYTGPGPREPAAAAGAVALRDGRRDRKCAGPSAAVREPRRLSLALRRGERELSRTCRLPHRASGPARATVERERRHSLG